MEQTSIEVLNKKLNGILDTTKQAMNLYKSLSRMKVPPKEELQVLQDHYKEICGMISEYYSLLEKNSIDAKESYLTAWLYQYDGRINLDFIEDFLCKYGL